MGHPSSSAGSLEFVRLTLADVEDRSPRFRLSEGVIQVHAFMLDTTPDVRQRCGQWLSQAEHERAQRFRFEEDRGRYMVAHGYLRHLLGAYCGKAPASLEFRERTGGKPILVGEGQGAQSIGFSLTHSHGRALVAAAVGFDVGVDLERMRHNVDYAALARRFFSPAECRIIMAAEPDGQRREFFRHWVGKESILKARGTGLRVPLHECELRFTDGQTALVQSGCMPAGAADVFTARFLPLAGDWVGAVAAEGTEWRWASSSPT
ncbi:4'-phosphopantetheinyl transferase family protein [Nitrospira moscoviensis]|uniref:Putative 4'-phosphopantetheinyl transferase HetI n=1 Tax=Nitrospira moscoviensis TaxID=42253 RepID=A0A0K2GD50_NITMO|nr:4'-phosphopantetheinyl transferase superfamily protein [Nitrospira moscoviensis]ALA58873.1 putative 4'-phosphopantetheinyl transferase HetI [Nitrospira moscoviensis]